MEFFKYRLTSEALYLGERIKGGIFRPCVETIPYSQITGALRAILGREDIHAVGYLAEENDYNEVSYLVYSSRDRVAGKSKVPIRVEYLANVLGWVFISKEFLHNELPQKLLIYMGGLKSKGFGKCKLEFVEVTKATFPKKPQELNVRIPVRCAEFFGIKNVLKPIYGYLFKPTSHYTGLYELSLFEGSIVVAPEIFLRRE
jgi:hypothetical protein